MPTPEELNSIDKDILRRSPQQADDAIHVGLPQESVTFNIGTVEGKDIQFGDRNIITYVTVDAIKIRNLIAHSPYKGLKPFEKDDTDRFFGRTAFVEKLFHELRSSNLLLLLGASGSGKSSVIRAGLIPRLAQEYARFMALTLTPGQDPFEGLYTSLYPRFQEKAALAREGKEDTLLQVVRSLKPADEQWFLLLDQFEELFTTSAPERQKPFIAGLVRLNEILAKAQHRSVQIIATMRSDFSHQLHEYPRLVNALKNQCLMLTAMQPDELRLVIEQPAAKHGVVFEKELMIGQFAAQPDVTVEEGLVAQMMKDVQGQPGYLPLLQYTLDLLWETERKSGGLSDRTLNISTYQQLGGVRGALQKHVDEIYEKLSESMQLEVKRIFLKLVDIEGNAESEIDWKPIRKRALRSKFTGELEERVLIQLIDASLLVSNQQSQVEAATVEIAHEALLTSWATLNTWIKEHCQEIALRSQFSKDLERWQKSQKEGDLLTGSRLEQARELRHKLTVNRNSRGLEPEENQFIDLSLGLNDRQRKRTIMGLSGFSIFALVLAGFAGWQWRQAELGQVEALSGSSEVLLASGRNFEALIEGLKAAQRLAGVKGSSMQTVLALQQAVYGARELNSLDGHQDAVESVSFSPDGRMIASASADKSVKLWTAEGKELLTLKGHQDTINRVSFSPDGKMIATASRDTTVKLWSLKGKEIRTFRGHAFPVISMSFSPDGKSIASASADGTVNLWTLEGRQLQTFQGHYSLFMDVRFSPDGKTLAIADFDGVKLWSLEGKEIRTLRHQLAVNSVSFNPNGKTLATAGFDGTVKLWTIAGKEIRTFKGHTFPVTSVSFSPNGKILATASWDTTVKLWSVEDEKKDNEIATFRGHKNYATSVSFSPDGKTLATASWDTTVKLWSVEGKEPDSFIEHLGTTSMGFSPDGKTIATASVDEVNLWSRDGKELYTHSLGGSADAKNRNYVASVKFSPDSKTIALVSKDQTVRLWTLASDELRTLTTDESLVHLGNFNPDDKIVAFVGGKIVKLMNLKTHKEYTLAGHQDTIESLSFSPDRKTIATASDDKTVKLWDLEGKELRTLRGHGFPVSSVSFSPDGKMIASASLEEVKLWSLEGKELSTLRGHGGFFFLVSFSPDSKSIATTDATGAVKLWDLSLNRLVLSGCSWLKDYFTSHPSTQTELKICR